MSHFTILTQTPPLVANTAILYQYEPFRYDVSLTIPGETLVISNSDPEVLTFATTNGIDASYSAVSGYQTSYSTTKQFLLQTTVPGSNGPVETSSLPITVSISPGRWKLDVAGPYSFPVGYNIGSNYFFSNTIGVPTSNGFVNPALPVGMSFTRYDTSGNIWRLNGTPTAQTISRNYQFVGRSTTGKTVTANIVIDVTPPTIIVTPPGGSILLYPFFVIPSISLTAAKPVGYSGNLSWKSSNALPYGLSYLDSSGNPFSNQLQFTTTDASSTVVVSGAADLTTAYAFLPSNLCNISLNVTNGSISNNVPLSFTFSPTVLFTSNPSFSNIYVGVPYDSSSNGQFLTAFTYFGSGTPISNIFSLNLPSDISTNFNSVTGRMRIVATNPGTAYGTNFYTFRATNSNGLFTDISSSVTIINDVVTMTSTMDACSTFILSRPISNSLAGYYTSNLQFTANAGSGSNVVFSSSGLNGSGLSLSNVTSNTVQLVGIPTSVQSLSNFTVTATANVTGATSSLSKDYSIINDVITISDFSLNSIQNKPLVPYQITSTTLSGRTVVSYVGSNVPSGVIVNSSGLITGSIQVSTSGTATVLASTGYASGSRDFSYNTTPDSILLFTDQSVYPLTPGGNVDIPVYGACYSGGTVSNYRFSNLVPTYGLTINSNTGLIGGTLYTGLPPTLLPASCNFDVKGTSGILDGVLSANLTTINPYVKRAFVVLQDVLITTGETVGSTVYASDNLSNWFIYNPLVTSSNTSSVFQISNDPITDYYVSYNGPSSNEIDFVHSSISRYTTGPNFSNITDFTLRTISSDGSGNFFGVAGQILQDFTGPGFSYFDGSVFRTTDGGETWGNSLKIPGTYETAALFFYPRNITSNSPTVNNDAFYTYDPYATFGIAFRYKNGVMLLGGQKQTVNYSTSTAMLASFDQGGNWTKAINGFDSEVANFCLDHPTIWMATGSELYFTNPSSTYGPAPSTPSATIKYSTNSGSNWSDVSGGFGFMGYDITYGGGKWMATGISNALSGFIPQLRTSSDGSNWSLVDLSSNPLFCNTYLVPLPRSPIGPIMYDGSNWNVFVVRDVSMNIADPSYITELYTHSASTDLTSNWSSIVLTDFPAVDSNGIYRTGGGAYRNARDFSGFIPDNFISTALPANVPYLTFQSGIAGPVVDSPTQTSYLVYQFIPIQPILISGSSTGTVYYFIASGELPIGLTFDPVDHTVRGTPAHLGTFSFKVFLKDSITNGVTTLSITIEVILPSVARRQPNASSYTSYVRQYVVADAAQNSRDNKVDPSQTKTRGEFMAPPAPNVISACATCASTAKPCPCIS